jgi:hypothetical protein
MAPSGAENIQFYAALRGFSAADTARVVSEAGAHLDMADHMHKLVRVYSGGTARKLSFLIACLGDPAVLFLGASLGTTCSLPPSHHHPSPCWPAGLPPSPAFSIGTAPTLLVCALKLRCVYRWCMLLVYLCGSFGALQMSRAPAW